MEQDYVCSITPTEFEKYCIEILLSYAEEEKLPNFTITHDAKIAAYDGTYQIDIYAEFTAMSVTFKVLCECKQYSKPVGRDKVAELHGKLESIGANKGSLLATSGFQSGAIEYAKTHGIALIQVYDSSWFQYPPAVEHRPPISGGPEWGGPCFSDCPHDNAGWVCPLYAHRGERRGYWRGVRDVPNRQRGSDL